MKYEIFEDIGKQKRLRGGINEDSVGVNVVEQGHRNNERSTGVFVVADGAGGHDKGDVASYLATTVILDEMSETLLRHIRSTPNHFGVDVTEERKLEIIKEDDITTAIEDAILNGHREIIRYAREADTQALTTVLVGVYIGNKLHYGWVGDSPAFVVNTEKKTIEQITKDHSKVEIYREEGKIDDAEALVHPEGHKIARALGGTQFEQPETASVEIDTGVVDLYADDIVLLTSDGLVDAANTEERVKRLYQEYQKADNKEQVAEKIRTEVVTETDIREIVLEAESLDVAAERLVAFANESDGKDNLSGVLVSDASLPETPDEELTRSIYEESIEELSTKIETESDSEATREERNDSGETDATANTANATESVNNDDDGAEKKRTSTHSSESNAQVTPENGERDDEQGGGVKAVIRGLEDFFPGDNSKVKISPGATVGRHDKKPEATVEVVDELEMISPEHIEFDYTEEHGWLVRDKSINGTLIRRGDSWNEIRSVQSQRRQLRQDEKRKPIEGIADVFSLEDGDEIALVHEQVVSFTFETR